MGISVENIQEYPLNINEICPDLFLISPGISNKIRIKNNFKYKKEQEAKITWKQIKVKKNIVLGYQVILNFGIQNKRESKSDLEKIEINLSEDICYEFKYCKNRNAFYLENNTTNSKLCKVQSLRSLKNTENINYPIAISTMNNSNQNTQPKLDSIPLFYRKFIPIITKIAEEGYGADFLTKILSKTNYAQNIETFRITPSGFVKVANEIGQQEISFLNEELIDPQDSSSKNNKTDIKKLLKQSLKNRKGLKRAIRMMKTPLSFIWLIVILGLGLIVAVAIAGTQYIVYDNLFYTLESQMNTFYYIPDQYINLMDSLRYIIQAISVNEYFSSLYKNQQ